MERPSKREPSLSSASREREEGYELRHIRLIEVNDELMKEQLTNCQFSITLLREANHTRILSTNLSEFDFTNVAEDVAQGLPSARGRKL